MFTIMYKHKSHLFYESLKEDLSLIDICHLKYSVRYYTV